MSQAQILEELQYLRTITNEWFSSGMLRPILLAKGYSASYLKVNLYDDLLKLSAFNAIQAKGIGLVKHMKVFRAYKKRVYK
jgi:hypothetical protein